MYINLESNKKPLIVDNVFYEGDTSIIYREGEFLYKKYLKREPFKRQKLDFLIEHYDDLKSTCVPPMAKLKIDDNFGMKMRFVDGIDFLTYLNSNSVPPEEMLRVIKILSDNLKSINNLGIHFSDLHHHNILLRKNDLYPIYIDLDDASIKDYGSTHICVMAHRLHDLKNKSYEYEDELIKYGNLDQECLTLMLLNYIMSKSMERLSYDEFHRYMDDLSLHFSSDFMEAVSALKGKDSNDIVIPYKYYIGDYIQDDNVSETLRKIMRR